MEDSDAHSPIPWDDLVLVGSFPTLDQAHDHGLVILAMGQACWVSARDENGNFQLHAEIAAAPRIRAELEMYAAETEALQREKARPDWIDQPVHSAGSEILWLWMLSLLVVFYLQGTHPDLADKAASSSIGIIQHHEWWRPFTALFLHADVQHLVGNILSGAIFAALVSRLIGPLRGWLLILGSGTMGNLLTALVRYPEPYLSIGASTAVFGALGILTGLGFSITRRFRWKVSWARAIAPILAGIVLLGWLGGGGHGGEMQTDVVGHVFGFSSGLVSGLIVGETRRKPSKAPQLSLS
jgi:rhomboid protease GluP